MVGCCSWLLQHTNAGVAWLFNMTYSLLLVFISSWTVVTLAPQASGAGVAEVMAYLNGCLIPKVRDSCAAHSCARATAAASDSSIARPDWDSAMAPRHSKYLQPRLMPQGLTGYWSRCQAPACT